MKRFRLSRLGWLCLSAWLLASLPLALRASAPAPQRLWLPAVMGGAGQPIPERPNIVYIFTDDQRWDTLCGTSDPAPSFCDGPASSHPMPTVEQELMAQGVVFRNALVSLPTCCPSRASFLSGGFFAHHTGVLANTLPNGGVQRFADATTLPTLLQASGYRTALIGKYLNQYKELAGDGNAPPYIPPGWDHFAVEYNIFNWNGNFQAVLGSSTSDRSGTGTIQAVTDGTHVTDWERDQALAFLDESCDGGQCVAPFFLFFSARAPHAPATPAPRHAALFPTFEYRGRGWNEETTGKPAYVSAIAEGLDVAATDDFARNQLRTLRGVDEAVAAILNDLRARDLLDQTVIIFASDNGFLWAEHQLTEKNMPYDEALRVPLVIRAPGIAPGVVEQLVSVDLDVAPTLLELAGVAPIGSDGASLLPLLRNPQASWRDALLIQGGFQLPQVPVWAGVRTDGWKYVEYVTGERELYDLVADPFELQSRHDEPAHQAIQATLAAQLDGLQRGVAIRTDTLPDPQTNALPPAARGQGYHFRFSAWGGNGSYTWAPYSDGAGCSGALPPGLALSADGTLSGTPTLAGTWHVCVRVQDSSTSPQPGNDRPQALIADFQLQVH